MILAGGAGTRLDILAEHRAKPAVPFAGKYRIIDFTLSNCVNSGISYVAVLTQYLPRSLSDHIGIGRPWDFDRKFGGITILPPYHGKAGEWYNGTAQAVFQNLDFIADKQADQVIILCGDHIYKMDYRLLLREHEARGADLTIATSPVDLETASKYGILTTDSGQRIVDFEEKPQEPRSNLASMGIYVFKASFLQQTLARFCHEKRSVDFGKDVIPGLIGTSRVYAYRFNDYWRDVGTLEDYWSANMEQTLDRPPFDLYTRDEHDIYTKNWEIPPAKFGHTATVARSLVSGGCIIHGNIEDSVLSSNVVVEEGASVKNSIIFDRTIVRKGSVIDRTIIDKDVVIGENCHIGVGSDMRENAEVPQIVHSGLNLIGKHATIPPGTVIGRNCRVLSNTTAADFTSGTIGSGETVAPPQ
jgi:glucose-1-phosphate adenylyltransferase